MGLFTYVLSGFLAPSSFILYSQVLYVKSDLPVFNLAAEKEGSNGRDSGQGYHCAQASVKPITDNSLRPLDLINRISHNARPGRIRHPRTIQGIKEEETQLLRLLNSLWNLKRIVPNAF